MSAASRGGSGRPPHRSYTARRSLEGVVLDELREADSSSGEVAPPRSIRLATSRRLARASEAARVFSLAKAAGDLGTRAPRTSAAESLAVRGRQRIEAVSRVALLVEDQAEVRIALAPGAERHRPSHVPRRSARR